MFEDCIHDAELEQKEIVLPPGTFWFDYQTSKVNDKYDIEKIRLTLMRDILKILEKR